MRRRRGFVLLVVLVAVGCAILVVTGIVFLVRGEVAGATNAIESTQLRAASWSAVQAVASQLAGQRERVLVGATPTIEMSLVLWETPSEIARARLLPVAADGARVVAEASRVDLRTVTAASLGATGFVSEAEAAAIVAARDAAGGFVQPDSLLGAGGIVTAESLLGPLDDISLELDEDEEIRSGAALERLLAGGARPRGLADLLTGFAEEPPLRADGSRRLSLNGEWTDDRRGEVDVLLGSGSATLLEAVTKETDSASDVNLFAAWRAKHPDPREWQVFLDAITADDRPVLLGRLDVLRASGAALRSLPGIDEERAANIERLREALTDEERRTPAWLVARGILGADEFAAIVDRVTMRSFFWRVRVVASVANPNAGAEDEPGRFAAVDVVIDLSQRTPRIAWMRDVSSLETAARIVADLDRPNSDDAPVSAPTSVDGISEDEPTEIADIEMPETAPPATVMDAPAAPSYPRGAGRWRPSR